MRHKKMQLGKGAQVQMDNYAIQQTPVPCYNQRPWKGEWHIQQKDTCSLQAYGLGAHPTAFIPINLQTA